jgi:hypothetical protein
MAGEALPDATSTVKALRYVQTQAVHGYFKGHPTALLVMYYLVTNMWVRPSGDGQGQGEVVRSRSAIESICEGTALSRSSVQRALGWLAEEEWIDTQRALDQTGRETHRYLYVKLDMPGHRERERRRVMATAAESILTEASRP